MIRVNVARGYSGVYLFHILDLETHKAESHWVSPDVVWEIFNKTAYFPKFQDAWKLHPTKRSRTTKTIEFESDPNGELDWLIGRLKERIYSEQRKGTGDEAETG